MRDQDFTQHDLDLLDKVEQIIAGTDDQNSGDGAVTDAVTLYGFCAHLAHTAPQADASFRQELLARVVGAMPAEQPTEASAHRAPALNGSAPHGVDSKRPLRAGKSAKLLEKSRVPLNNWHALKRGRVGSAAAALAGLVIMLALFSSMAFMLKARKELNRSQGTPTAIGANNIEPARGIAPLQTLDAARVQYMAWSPNGAVLATGYGTNVELWAGSGATGKLLQRLQVYSVSGLDWSPDGKLLAVGETQNSIRLFDVASSQELHPTPSNMAMEPNSDAAWSPDGLLIASSFWQSPPNSTPGVPGGPVYRPISRTPLPGENDGLIRLWNPTGGNTVRVLRMPGVQVSSSRMASKLVWSPKDRYLAVLYGDSTTAIWDYTSTGPKVVLPSIIGKGARYSDAPRDIEWSSDGRTLARLAGDVVELWNADTGKRVRSMPDPAPPPIVPPPPIPTAVDPLHTPPPALMPPPVPTYEQGFIVTPRPQLPYPSPTAVPTYVYKDQEYGLVSGLAWSPDGGTLATFDGRNIRLWDTATGLQKRRMVSGAGIRKVAWSKDGAALFSLEGEPSEPTPPDMLPVTSDRYYYLDGTLKLWSATTGQQISATSQKGLSDFELSPDGKGLAVRVGAVVSLWSIDKGATPIATTPAALPTASTHTPPTAAGPTAAPLCGAWSIVPSPDKGKANYLRSVAAAAENDLWAVGFRSTSPVYGWKGNAYTGAGTAQTLIEHWDGAQWSIVPSPNAATGSSYLFGVAAASPSNV